MSARGLVTWHHGLVFFTGAVVLVLEILGTRVISPFFGSTLYVWSALIAVTLASLAAGYALGGDLADRYDARRCLCAALAFSGAWLLLVPLARGKVLLASVGLGVQAGALASAGVLFGAPLLCLGAVGPLCIRLRTTELSRVGREVGSLTAVSTVGSVLGALAAGFFLIPWLSVSRLLYSLGGALLVSSAACAWGDRRRAGAVLLLLAAAGGAGAVMDVRPRARAEGILREKAASFYGDLKVVDRPSWGKRVLYIDGVANTVVDLDTLESTSDYVTAFELLPILRPGARKALLVGLGGGGIVERFHRWYGISTDVVEIDPAIEPLARAWFGYRPTGGLFVEDGRAFLARPGDRYDFIVLDAFNGDQHPSHLFTREAFELMRGRLGPDGVLGINVIGYAYGPKARLRRSIARTLREVFPHVRGFVASRGLPAGALKTPQWWDSTVNLTFLASVSPMEPRRAIPAKNLRLAAFTRDLPDYVFDPVESGGELITDDRNPIEALSAPAFLAMRKSILEDTRRIMAY